MMHTQQTYRFMDDASSVKTSRLSMQTPISLMGKEEKVHSIESFAMRPMEIGNFPITTKYEASHNVFGYQLLDLLKNVNVKGKFEGFRYFRADVQIQVYYNAQPFQQGALLGWYIPYKGEDIAWSQSHSLTSKTGCLSETVLFEDQEPLTLTIPFNHPHGFIDLVDPKHCDMGKFNLDIYSPLQSNVASDVVNITVFAHFVNIKLYGPTDETQHLTVAPQMGEAEEQEKTGIVTKVSGAVREVSSALADVPVIGVVAKPISWVASAVNKVASLFGWSKPISVHTTSVFKLAPARYMTNYNGVDTSNNMGLDADNQIENYPFFGKEDPLSFNNIITRPNFIGSYAWDTTMEPYDKIMSLDVSPTLGWSFEEVANDTKDFYAANIVRNVSQMNFVAQYFKYWRGNVVLQFKCIKTKFHSGRLLVTWRPGSKVTTSNPRVPMTYSIVWEVAKRKSIAFEIPYLNPKPWLFVENPEQKLSPTDIPWKNGVVEVFVLNTLVASSDAIANEARILVEVCGGKDFAFAVPVNPTLFPTTLGDVKRIDVPSAVDEVDLVVKPEIGIDSDLVPFIPEGTVDVGIEPEKMSIGEKIVSFRQLIKRFSEFQLAGKQGGTEFLNPELTNLRNVNKYALDKDGIIEAMTVCDFDYANVSYDAPQATKQEAGGVPHLAQKFPFTTDLLTNVCSIFAYTRGSIRMKFAYDVAAGPSFSQGGFAMCQIVNSNGKDLDSIELHRGLAAVTHRAATAIVVKELEGIGEVQFPYYSDVVYMPKHWADFSKYNQDFGRVVTPMPNTSDVAKFTFWRAAGDDFDTAFLMGAPQLQYVDTTSIRP